MYGVVLFNSAVGTDIKIYTLEKKLLRFGPFLTLSVRDRPSVSFGTNFPCIGASL